MPPTVAYNHIALNADGRPVIDGTGFKVIVVIRHVMDGATPQEIRTLHPQLSFAQIYAALAYYYDNQAELDAAMSAGDRLADELRPEGNANAVRLRGKARSADPDA